MHEWQIESLHVFDDFIKEGSQFYDSTILDLLLTTSAVLAVAARHLTIFLGHRMTTALRSKDSPADQNGLVIISDDETYSITQMEIDYAHNSEMHTTRPRARASTYIRTITLMMHTFINLVHILTMLLFTMHLKKI